MQGTVNALIPNERAEALIIGGMKDMRFCGKRGELPIVWPLKYGSCYVLVSVPVGANETIRAAGILAGITPITGEGVMA